MWVQWEYENHWSLSLNLRVFFPWYMPKMKRENHWLINGYLDSFLEVGFNQGCANIYQIYVPKWVPWDTFDTFVVMVSGVSCLDTHISPSVSHFTVCFAHFPAWTTKYFLCSGDSWPHINSHSLLCSLCSYGFWRAGDLHFGVVQSLRMLSVVTHTLVSFLFPRFFFLQELLGLRPCLISSILC